MGLAPVDVDRMSLWEFTACVDGWNRAHGDGKPPPPTEDEFEAALRKAGPILETLH